MAFYPLLRNGDTYPRWFKTRLDSETSGNQRQGGSVSSEGWTRPVEGVRPVSEGSRCGLQKSVVPLQEYTDSHRPIGPRYMPDDDADSDTNA